VQSVPAGGEPSPNPYHQSKRVVRTNYKNGFIQEVSMSPKKIWGKKLNFQSLRSNLKPAEMSLQEVLTASQAAEMEMMLQMVLLEQEMLFLRPLPSTTQNPQR
jgi:hypothetical protein